MFYAERVWDVIKQADPSRNLLQVEERLADLSDVVVVIVESPGTFAELGAFAISQPLRKKLLPILEAEYRNDPSFIRTGPVEWVDQDSAFGPSVWLTQKRILESIDHIEERLARVPSERARRVTNLLESPKHLFFFVCDLVAVFGPCTEEDVKDIAREILQNESFDVALYVGLGTATGVLQSLQHEGRQFFFRPLDGGRLRSFHRTRKLLDIPTLRARMLSAMQASRDGVKLLHVMGTR